MATLENGKNNAKSSRRGISFELQSKDLPSRRLLGKGLSGIGYETAWKGARYARKDFVGVQRDIFVQEATVLVGLKDHENIVKTYGWTVDKRSCSLVLEYMDEDLLSLLQKRMDSKRVVVGKDLGNQSSTFASTQPVDLPEAVDMMLQIATGVEYLHEQGLTHGDLKTKNILVTHRKDGEVSSKVLKLSDFGLVGTKRKSRSIVSRKVRKLDMVRWKSPESLKILSGRLHSSNGDEDETSSESESESTPSSVPDVSSACAGIKSSDVYSFALICSQILTGHSPYPYLDWKELMVKILSGCRPDLPVSCHPLLRELLISCWGAPAERPSFSAVCMKLKRVQGLLITAMGKRPQEVAAPSVADSRAHQAAVALSTEVSTSSGNCLSPKPSEGHTIGPYDWITDVIIMSNAPGIPSAAFSAPSPPATAAASPAADESYVEIRSPVDIVPSSEPTQIKDVVQHSEEVLLRHSIAGLDPKRFLDRSSDQLFTTRSDLTTVRRGSNLAGTSFLKKFVGGTSRICDTSATEVKTDTGQRKREESTNQWLLRRILHIPTLQVNSQQGIQTRGAVLQSIGSQRPPLTSPTSVPHRGADEAPIMVHATAVRHRRNRQRENFAALRSLVPIISKSDKASILGDAIGYLKDLQMQIHGLEASKSQVERQYKDLKLSHEDLEQRNQQLQASKSQLERQYEDLKLSHQVLEQRNQQLEASERQVEHRYHKGSIFSHWDFLHQRNKLLKAAKNEVKSECEEVKLSPCLLEQRNKLLEATKNEVKNEYEEVKLSPWDLEQRNKLLEATKNEVKSECEEVKLSPWDLGATKQAAGSNE